MPPALFHPFCDWRSHRPKWELLLLAMEGVETLSGESLPMEMLLIKMLPMLRLELEKRLC